MDLADKSIKAETLEDLMRNGNTTGQPSEQKQDEQAKVGLKFTNEEIRQMPKTFKKEFRAEGCTAHIRKRPCGKETFTYEIRYRRNGYNITITDKNLENGKRRFIEALKMAEETKQYGNIPYTFNAFSNYYFQKFRIHKVTPQTFKKDMSRYNLYLKPYFKEKPLKRITPDDCQRLLDDIKATGKSKTTEEIRALLMVIFKMAIAHHLINHNPLDVVFYTKHENEHGEALTKEEERILFTALADNLYRSAFALALYTGLRPNELKTAKIEGKFIVAINSKRKNGKIEYKKIPITKMLAPYLEGRKLNIPCYRYMREKVKEILPNHKLYDLRTTFYSRCKECGISEHAMKEFVGHSLGKLGNAYTDLSDVFLLREGEKFAY
ncbi:MAG: hypothetical protein IJ506_02970 [Clostridia bacterium]|nr:hypothetical protein [Clostridia bacterium]